MIDQSVTLKFLYRYPIKGLSAQILQRTILSAGQTIPGDRTFAIENGPCGFDPAAPTYFQKQHFLMLMRHERLAALHIAYDDAGYIVTIKNGDKIAVCADLYTPDGRAAIEEFFARYCVGELRGPPKILYANDHSFSDVSQKVISVINLASLAAIENAVGRPVHPLRFRGNLYVEGWPAWHEFDLIGHDIVIGATRLKVIKRIRRCAATDVDPETGNRDLTVPRTLMKAFGHADCGIYAQVIRGGVIAIGDAITVNR
jgi:MOSC domain-containing protein